MQSAGSWNDKNTSLHSGSKRDQIPFRQEVGACLQTSAGHVSIWLGGSSNPGISWSVSKQIPNLITSGYTIEIKASQMINCCAGESQRCRRADTSQGEHVFFMPWSPTEGLECWGCRVPNQDMNNQDMDIVPMADTGPRLVPSLYVKLYQNNLKNRISLRGRC